MLTKEASHQILVEIIVYKSGTILNLFTLLAGIANARYRVIDNLILLYIGTAVGSSFFSVHKFSLYD